MNTYAKLVGELVRTVEFYKAQATDLREQLNTLRANSVVFSTEDLVVFEEAKQLLSCSDTKNHEVGGKLNTKTTCHKLEKM